jgi:hypothetical protein
MPSGIACNHSTKKEFPDEGPLLRAMRQMSFGACAIFQELTSLIALPILIEEMAY